MKVLVSGNFDPFHYAHLDYIKKAAGWGDYLVCLVSSDIQVKLKKGQVNEPEQERAEILHLILKGLDIPHWVLINTWDNGTSLVGKALKFIKPDIFCRGTDKKLEDMPIQEKKVCDELGIKIVHIKGKIVHGSEFK